MLILIEHPFGMTCILTFCLSPPPFTNTIMCVFVCVWGGGGGVVRILRRMHCAIYCLFMSMCISKEIISIHCIFNLYLLTLTVHYHLRMTCVVLIILTKTPPRASQSTIKWGSRGGGAFNQEKLDCDGRRRQQF